MARPTLTTHRKFRRLARLLGGQAVARGTLELVWDTAYASGEARIGDALDVEEAAQWQGEAGVCVQALVACGFLDADADGEKFSVHDLFDHAPQYVRRRFEREQARKRPAVASQRLASDAPVSSTPARAPAPAPNTRTQHAHPAPVPTNGTDVSGCWDAWRDATATVGLTLPLTPKGRDHAHLTTLAEASLPRGELDAVLRLFLQAPSFETKRSLGMFASNLPQLVAWHRQRPGVPYGAKAPPRAASPPGVAREWDCPHTPHCTAYYGCQRLTEIEQAKAEVAHG